MEWALKTSLPPLFLFYLLTFAGIFNVTHLWANPLTEPTDITFSHAIALHGKPGHPSGFKHFNYVNPKAPKGGTIRIAALGTFDTFNSYGPQGKAPFGLYLTSSTLLTRNWDEPLTKYGFMVEKIEQPADKSWIAFHINPKAVFSDGKPVTAEDVVFSFQRLIEQGNLFWRQFYQDVDSAKATSKYRALFTYKYIDNLELPLLLGQLPVLPKHWWQERDFTATTLEVPVVSGPYRIKRFQTGRYIEYERIKDYWAENHPVNVGRNNFDIVRYEYFRDHNVVLEAVNSNQIDWHIEDDPRYWQDGFNKKALENGQLIKASWQNQNPQVLSLVLNTRRQPYSDIRVREAITIMLDIDWVVSHLLSNMMVSAKSLFDGTEMASTGFPEGDELKLLKNWQTQLPERLFTQTWPPGAEHKKRERIKYALSLFQKAGFKLSHGVMMSPSGKPLELELLLGDPRLERLLLNLVHKFAEIGISMKIKNAESARYLKSIRALDFDMILHTFRHTPSPGVEQRSFWGSKDREQTGTLNLAGINHPVIDHLVNAIPASLSRRELVTNIKALDRVLLWNFSVIPLLYNPDWQVVYNNRISPPETVPRYAIERTTWWAVPSRLNDNIKN